MNVTDPGQTLPPYLVETADMIRAAFPDGVSDEAYRPLLALLLEGMSFRTLATVVSYCTGESYYKVYNDVLGIESPGAPPPSELPAYGPVAAALRQHGYDEWLAESNRELGLQIPIDGG
jgi:hypothetical protein